MHSSYFILYNFHTNNSYVYSSHILLLFWLFWSLFWKHNERWSNCLLPVQQKLLPTVCSPSLLRRSSGYNIKCIYTQVYQNILYTTLYAWCAANRGGSINDGCTIHHHHSVQPHLAEAALPQDLQEGEVREAQPPGVLPGLLAFPGGRGV